MKKIFILLLSALSLTAFAQHKKVAVYVTGEDDGINQVLGDQLVTAFAKSGKYVAIERTASFLAELGKEQNYQRTGAVADSDISRLGKQFGVQLVCVAKISNVFGQKYVSARLIDVESAEVVNSANASSSLANMQELLNVAENITSELVSKTVQEISAETAAKQREYAETENKLKIQLEQGYVQVGNLYATTAYSFMGWSDARRSAKSCHIGNFSDWRIPNVTELNIAKHAIKEYKRNIQLYPNIAELINNININKRFWINNQKGITSDGATHKTKAYYSDQDGSKCWLLLVRDAK